MERITQMEFDAWEFLQQKHGSVNDFQVGLTSVNTLTDKSSSMGDLTQKKE